MKDAANSRINIVFWNDKNGSIIRVVSTTYIEYRNIIRLELSKMRNLYSFQLQFLQDTS